MADPRSKIARDSWGGNLGLWNQPQLLCYQRVTLVLMFPEYLKSQFRTWLRQSVKLKDLLHALLLRSGNLKGCLDMSPLQSKSHLCVLLRQSLSLKGRLRVLPW
ncbi:hypothetical protein AK812_SmicGene27440 [Symbiodinium microadriaticum]|uniref:Uncharacterized protein n=1 Tax=Symbiodinium microadriaticum TaxID=2951 RepID=A0A1Q9D6W4_SYMMI|nr:hypothetical protein AK812_SmicGene27440 [Symbiodinium microadriaticum]